jgi:MFS family permease
LRRFRATFTSLGNRNYRLFFAGHCVSVTGTWMQRVAQAWLVLELTGSGTLLGVTTALQFLPMLLAGPWAGLIADRVDKRRLLFFTQTNAGLSALALGVVTATGVVQLWMVMLLAFTLGLGSMFDVPARQVFLREMVGGEQLANAVTLNSIVMNGARIVGPTLAGVLIASVGMAPAFLFNAASYFAVVVALLLMDVTRLDRGPGVRREPGQLREGWRYVRRTPDVAAPLLLVGAVGMLAYEFQVLLPLLARYSFGGGAQTFGAMNSAMGLGAVVGGLVVAGSLRPSWRSLIGASSLLGVTMLAVSASPTLPVVLGTLFATGAASIAFLATVNSLLQLRSAPDMRGRVMALWSMALMGSTPIGGPLVGWIAEVSSPRFAVALGGCTALGGAGLLLLYLRRREQPRQVDRLSQISSNLGSSPPLPQPTTIRCTTNERRRPSSSR